MTLALLLIWAFIWNLIGATIGMIPLGLVFLISRLVARGINFFKKLFRNEGD